MPKMLTALLCLMAAILSTSARGQVPPGQAGNEDQQAMMEAVQPVMQSIMQNMQDKGIDPRTFFQQMQNGDPADIQKQLIDQGLVDKQALTTMVSTVQKIQANSIKRQLGVTDEQWAVLWPLIQKVQNASIALNGTRGGGGGGGGMGGMGGFMAAFSATRTETSKAIAALRLALKDPVTDASVFTGLLKNYRDARAQAQTDLDSAQQDLVKALDTRQEAILANLGIIE